MTLIATLAPNNIPVLLGDLLLTGPQDRPAKGRLAVPAIGDVRDFFGDSGWGIHGLSQKVCILSDTCAVAWAGSWLGARMAIGKLRERIAESALSVDEVIACLRSEPELKQHPASFIGLVHHDGSPWQFFVGDDVRRGKNATGHDFFYCGSGSDLFRRWFDMSRSAATHTDLESDTIQHSIAHALYLSSMLLRSDLAARHAAPTLLSMFGGAYEIAYFSERMLKVEATHVFWEARLGTRGVELSYPLGMIRQGYVGEHLVLRSARIDHARSFVEEDVQVINPMWTTSPPPPVALESFGFESRVRCNCVLLLHGNDKFNIAVRVDQGNDEEFGITYKYNDDFALRGVFPEPALPRALIALVKGQLGNLPSRRQS